MTHRNLVLATSAINQVATKSLVAVVVEDGQNAAVVQIAVLHDLVDGQVLAKFRSGQKLRLSLDSFNGQAADVVPGFALTSSRSLHGVVDGVLGIVVVVFSLLEDARSSIELELDLGSQGALEVDDPQRLFFANGDGFNLAGNKLDLEGFLKVLLVDDADLLSGIDFRVFLHNIFVELLSLGGKKLQGGFKTKKWKILLL